MKIEAKKGYVFALKDKTTVYGKVIYLGKYDSEENYIQMTNKQAEELKKELEAKEA